MHTAGRGFKEPQFTPYLGAAFQLLACFLGDAAELDSQSQARGVPPVAPWQPMQHVQCHLCHQ